MRQLAADGEDDAFAEFEIGAGWAKTGARKKPPASKLASSFVFLPSADIT
jgi:hypothetical protein